MTPAATGGAAVGVSKKAPPVKTGAKPADPSARPPEPKDPPSLRRQGALRSSPSATVAHPKEEKSPGSPKQPASGAGGASKPKLPDPMGSSSEEEGVSEHSYSKSKSQERSVSRSPLARRPHGTKQRKKFARGEYGDRVKFREPVARVVGEEPRETRAREGKGQSKGGSPQEKGKKGSGKDQRKGKGKGFQKGKGKHKGKSQEGKKGKKRRKNRSGKGAGGAGERPGPGRN